jgi:hypothetical protein
VDPFAIGVFVVVAAAVLASCLAARASSGRRIGELGGARGTAKQVADLQAARDAEDLEEMLAVTNARRRARGLPERSVDDAIREFGGE